MRNLGINKKRLSKILIDSMVYIVVALLICILAFTNDKFFTPANISNIFLTSAPYIIVAIGMIFALLTKGIDMSVGGIVFVSGGVGALAANNGASMGLVCIVMVVTGMVLGCLNGVLAAILNVYPLLITLATMFAFRGIGMMIIGNKVVLMPPPWANVLSGDIWIFPVTFLFSILLALIAQFVLRNTVFGRNIYAIGGNEKTAAEKGIHIGAVKVGVYCISGMMCGIAAIIWTNQIMSVTTILAKGIDFSVVVAAVLGGVSLFGGKGSVCPGAIVGAMVVSIITNAMVLLKVDSYLFTVVNALFIFMVVLVDTIKNRNSVG